MKKTTFNDEKFMEWYEDTFTTENHLAYAIVTNLVKYAKENLEGTEIVNFVQTILPYISAEEVSQFLITEISNLPDRYKWVYNEDGSGCIEGPDNTRYFSYDLAPHHNVGAVEYQTVPPFGPWEVHWEGFSSFVRYAEKEMRKRERESLHNFIVNEYYSYSVEFSSAFLDNPCTDFHMSLLDAVELYQDLQMELNGDYVFLVKDPVIEGKRLVSGTVCDFDEVFSIDDRMEKDATITLQLIRAEACLKTKRNYKLVRLDRYEYLYDNEIRNGEMMEFIF